MTAALATIPLLAAACGAASSATPPGGPGGPPSGTSNGSAPTAHSYAAALLSRVNVPAGAAVSRHAPSKALEGPPESPVLIRKPTVVTRYWTVDRPAASVYAWLKGHGPGPGLSGGGTGRTFGGSPTLSRFLAYSPSSRPASIAAGDLYLVVLANGPTSSAIGAYALTLAQPPRPAAETVPTGSLSKAVVGWSLARGGTPVVKVLTGARAVKLAREFNALRVDTSGPHACPLMPTAYGDVVVTFTAGAHSWKVDVSACAGIGVTRDGHRLPALASRSPFLDDLRTYAGHLPMSGPPQSTRGVVPLGQHASGH
ncbi:MAG: hypothetical protein QOI06_1979 [Nocardioidaceae bacterium]|nr:hypothetical protein [Nocardioidaceae bacterium]